VEKEITDLEEKVKHSLKNGSKMVAKNYLKKQKLQEKSLERKFAQLHNVESILEGIISAETNKKVVESYRSGLEALKVSLSSHNLEDVDELMGDIGETINKGEGLSFMLARTKLDDSEEMEELEKELEGLEEDVVVDKLVAPKDDQDLLAELDLLTVHDSSLEPVIAPSSKTDGKIPVAL